MGREIDSQALFTINRVLGLAGTGAAQQTILDDGDLTQVLDVNPFVRRGMTLASRTGIYFGIFRNVHGAGGLINNIINPYEAPNSRDGFPAVITVQSGLELWLLGASGERLSGAGGLDEGLLQILFSSDQQAFGSDDSGGAVASSANLHVARWDGVSTATTTNALVMEDGSTFARIGIRLSRLATGLRFISDASAAATFQLNVMMGLFPTGLGQDVI